MKRSSYSFSNSSSRFGKKRRGCTLPIFIVLVLAAAALWFLFFESTPPTAALNINAPYLGTETTLEIFVSDNKSGIRSMLLTAKQGDNETVLYNKNNQRSGYHNPVAPLEEKVKIAVNGKKLGFQDGMVELRLEVNDFSMFGWLKGNKTVITKKVTVDTVAPQIQILYSSGSIASGGTAIAIYKNNDPTAAAAVKLNDKFFPAYPVSTATSNTYISYFAIPYDVGTIDSIAVVASDQAGNTATIPLSTRLRKKNWRNDTIRLNDNFLNRKVPEFEQYYSDLQGNLLEKYVDINNKVRTDNAKTIAQICSTSEAERFWKGEFLRMAGRTMAGFADYRSYLYKGKVIDHQVHLGKDIASVKRASIKAANSGKVVYADYLGIYGNMIILDHGQGVFSLYSHLSQINVTSGTRVNKGELIGLTGTTGMAGGDHLHFSMLIHGIFVNPDEWWDKRWLYTAIDAPLEEQTTAQ